MRSAVTLGLLGAAASVAAHPAHKQPKQGLSRRTVDLDALRTGATASYVDSSEVVDVASFAPAAATDFIQAATDLVKSVVPGAEFRVVDDAYTGTNGISHVNFKQTAHGLDIDNADFNVNLRDGKVFSYGNNFFTGEIPEANPLKKRDFNDPATALTGAIEVLDLPITGSATPEKTDEDKELYTLKGTSGAVSEPQAKLTYLVKPDGTLGLSWRIETDLDDTWLLSYVDAKDNNKVHNVVDYVSHATYQVYPWGVNDPIEPGAARVVVTNPWDNTASPVSWIRDSDSVGYTTTRGNNAIAQVNPSGGTAYLTNYRPDNSSLNFQYPYSLTMTPPTTYRDASVAQLFYTGNMFHDLTYLLGFTEAAGNFQVNNFGKGGVGGDFVILNAQDGSGTNNANFATPPDGQPGRMRMYLWTTASPQRDCSFEAGVVIHEFTHGVSNRLTGGPANSGCLSALESGGMGEGWSDFLATAIRLKPSDTAATNYPMGEWVANNPKGIRSYLYSTSLTVNPQTYATTNSLSAVHAIGNVWASILYEVLWALIAKHGKNDADRPTFRNGIPTDGKFLTMKLVLDGMALQPCNPNFVQARTAIIDADVALTGGANACALWTAFAKRGLGNGASYGSRKNSVQSFTVPSGVC